MLVSKLPHRYPVADHSKWVTGKKQNLDPVFLGRIAYLGKTHNKVIHLTDGRRTHQEQSALYVQYLEYKRTGKGSIKLAAKPYTSSHEFGIAVDTSSQPLRRMINAELEKYGLCKPIRSEGWHIQPIETMYKKDFANWEPTEEEDMTKQEVIDIMNELDPVYKTVADVPTWARGIIKEMIMDKKILPDGDRIDISRSMLRTIIMLKR